MLPISGEGWGNGSRCQYYFQLGNLLIGFAQYAELRIGATRALFQEPLVAGLTLEDRLALLGNSLQSLSAARSIHLGAGVSPLKKPLAMGLAWN